MPVVAGEQLVATVTGQGHGDLGAGQRRHQVHGDLRHVAERFVPDVRQPGDDLGGGGVTDHERGVLGPEVGGHRGGLAGLVEGPVGEPHGVGPHRPGAVALHEGHHRARVHPAGQEGADGHVGHHPGGHRVGEHGLQPVGEFLGRAGQGPEAGVLDGPAGRPVGHRDGGTAGTGIGAHGDAVARAQFGHIPVHGTGGRDAVVPEVQGHGVTVERGAEPGKEPEALQFGGEGQPVPHPSVVQRLLAEPVPHQVELAEAAVPQGQGEHALGGVEGRVDPPLLHRRHQDLGVRPAAEREPLTFQAVAERPVVVERTVVVEHPPPVGRDHGLGPGRPQLHHRQPAVSEGQPALRLRPLPTGVGAPVGQCRSHRRHLADHRTRVGGPPRIEQAGDPAHGSGPGARRPAVRRSRARSPTAPGLDHHPIIGGGAGGVKHGATSCGPGAGVATCGVPPTEP